MANRSIKAYRQFRVVKVLSTDKICRTDKHGILKGDMLYSEYRDNFVWAFDLAEQLNGGKWTGYEDGRLYTWSIYEVFPDGFQCCVFDYGTEEYCKNERF